MKKIFLFLSAVLVSLAAGASITTQEWTFNNMDAWDGTTASFNSETGVVTANAWRGVGNWGEISTAEFDMLIVEISDHANAVQVKIKSINDNEDSQVEDNYLATESTIAVNQNCVALDLSSAKEKLKWIELNNSSNVDDATFKIKRIYALKNTGVEILRTVWSGENPFGDNWQWDNHLDTDPFSKAFAGDKMVVTYTKNADPQCQIKVRGSNEYLDFVGEYVDVNNATQASFLLSEADVALIREKGIYLNGKNMTIKAVQIVSSSLFRGEQKIEDWSGHQQIDAADLANIQVGNKLCVTIKEVDGTHGDKSPNLNLYAGGWADVNALADGNIALTGEFPREVEILVTYKMEKQLRGNYLLVRGSYYTFTDVSLKEGTPVNKVAAYLPVTSAGMATFIVPFNVPELPDGVQAYELTNNGDATIWATEVNALEADKPVLIVAAQNEDPGYEFVSEEGASDDISGKTGTYANGALIGTYTTIAELDQQTAGNYNYVLQNQGGKVAFYQVRDNSCSVAPYRAYLSCGHDASNNGANFAPRMRIVFHKDATTGIESQELKANSQKLIRNGQILIIRDNKMFNVLGQQL